MPLVSMNQVHRAFPVHFAERFGEHVRQRRESYRRTNTNGGGDGTGHLRREQVKKKERDKTVFASNVVNSLHNPVIDRNEASSQIWAPVSETVDTLSHLCSPVIDTIDTGSRVRTLVPATRSKTISYTQTMPHRTAKAAIADQVHKAITREARLSFARSKGAELNEDTDGENSMSSESTVANQLSANASHRGCSHICQTQNSPNNVTVTNPASKCPNNSDNKHMSWTDGSLSSQPWWDWRTRSRGSAVRSVSQTTVSLESVDLWESDSEDQVEPSTGVKSGKDAFDLINGVVINPSKTFDFPGFRQSHIPGVMEDSVRRVQTRRCENSATAAVEWSAMKESENCHAGGLSSEKREQKQTVAERLLYLQQKQKEIEFVKCNKKNLELRKHQKIEVERKQQKQQQWMILAAEKQWNSHAENEQSKHIGKHEKLKVEKHWNKQPDRQHQGIGLEPQCMMDTKTILSTKTKHIKSILTLPKEPITKIVQNSYKMHSTSQGKPQAKLVTETDIKAKTHSAASVKALCPRPIGACGSSDTFLAMATENMAAVEEAASVTYPLTSRRRVKFNAVVSVHDGEQVMEDELQWSKNSAQLFKQRYLRSRAQPESANVEEYSRLMTPTPDYPHLLI